MSRFGVYHMEIIVMGFDNSKRRKQCFYGFIKRPLSLGMFKKFIFIKAFYDEIKCTESLITMM
jgi:hypothetical protein